MKQVLDITEWDSLPNDDKMVFYGQKGHPDWMAQSLRSPTLGKVIEFLFMGETTNTYTIEWDREEELIEMLWKQVPEKLKSRQFDTFREELSKMRKIKVD